MLAYSRQTVVTDQRSYFEMVLALHESFNLLVLPLNLHVHSCLSVHTHVFLSFLKQHHAVHSCLSVHIFDEAAALLGSADQHPER
jgi:hypothetical protein